MNNTELLKKYAVYKKVDFNTLEKDFKRSSLFYQKEFIQKIKKSIDFEATENSQFGGSTYVQKPISPFAIQKNQKDILEEEYRNRQTQLKSGRTNQPNREFYEKENSIREANQRINKRQDQVNTLGAALSPVPVVGEVYNMGSTIANGVVDAFQGEYEDVAMSAADLALSKIPLGKTSNRFTPEAQPKFGRFLGNISEIPKTFNPLSYFNISSKKEKGINWLNNWYNDPKTIEKFNNIQSDLTDRDTYNAATHYSEYIYPNKKWTPEDVERLTIPKSDTYASSLSNYDTFKRDKLTGAKKIVRGDTQLSKLDPDKISTTIHEGTHQLTHNGGFFNKKTADLLQQGFKENTDEILPDWSGKIDKSYYVSPTEIHARINEIRHSLKLKPSDVVTEKMLGKVFRTRAGLELSDFIKDKKLFLETLNKIPAVAPVVIGASQIEQKQFGGESNSILKQLSLL